MYLKKYNLTNIKCFRSDQSFVETKKQQDALEINYHMS